ncbi:hypothetical protein evm_001470 [Chilo suppressalis]|nr:hypothetical protein evm_001470 [Chilo suppressalis]
MASDSVTSLNKVNAFYANIGSELASKVIPPCSSSDTDSFQVSDSIVLTKTDETVLLSLSIENCNIYTYADDTALLVTGKSWTEVQYHDECALTVPLKDSKHLILD